MQNTQLSHATHIFSVTSNVMHLNIKIRVVFVIFCYTITRKIKTSRQFNDQVGDVVVIATLDRIKISFANCKKTRVLRMSRKVMTCSHKSTLSQLNRNPNLSINARSSAIVRRTKAT